MEKENFIVEANYALNFKGQHIDLHNNFDFVGFKYSSETNSLSLLWLKAEGEWIRSDEFNKVEMAFKNVKFLKVSGDELKKGDVDSSKTLALLGYLHPDDVERMDGSLDEGAANSDYHMIFLFENDLAIKVYSSRVICNVA